MKIIVTFLILMIITSLCWSQNTLTLKWDDSNSTNYVAGYYIYYGISNLSYTNKIDVGFTTNSTVTNLVIGQTYYFALSCYNVLGLESDYSSEFVYTTQDTPKAVFLRISLP